MRPLNSLAGLERDALIHELIEAHAYLAGLRRDIAQQQVLRSETYWTTWVEAREDNESISGCNTIALHFVRVMDQELLVLDATKREAEDRVALLHTLVDHGRNADASRA